MGGYKNGKVEIFYGDSPPANLNILWQKRIVTNNVESSELMQYNNNLSIWESLSNASKASLVSPAFTGTPTINGEQIATTPQNGTNYVMVYGTGTPTENAAELQAAYNAAKIMPRYLGFVVDADMVPFTAYKGQTFTTGANVHIKLNEDLINSVFISVSFDSNLTEAQAKLVHTVIVVAPGDYGNPTIEEVSGIDIVSLTGNNDILINGIGHYGIGKGTNYIMVHGKGTPSENAIELQNAYSIAKTMPRYLGSKGVSDSGSYYKGQTFLFSISGEYIRMTADLIDYPATPGIGVSAELVTEAIAKSAHTTVIVAPGDYTFGSPIFVADTEYINIISLTGNADVMLDGMNLVVDNVFLSGINCSTFSLYTANSLANIYTKNCVGGYGSFGGEGSIFSGTATDCTAGDSSFGLGGTLNGLLENCKLTAGTYQIPTGAGKIINCINADGSIYNSVNISTLGTITANVAARKLTVGGDTTISKLDSIVICDPAEDPMTVTLPTAIGINGKVITIRSQSNTITVARQAGQAINGATSDYTLTVGNSATFVSLGIYGWYTI